MNMFKRSVWGSVFVLLLSATATAADKQGPPLVVSLKTIDGSSLTGLVEADAEQPAKLPTARLVPWDQISAVRFVDDRRQAEITLKDGEAVRGRIVSKKVQLTTVIGRLAVPWEKIAELTVDRPPKVPDELIESPTPRCPIRFEVTLHDGSRVLGTPQRDAANLHSAAGRFEVPWARVRKVSFHDDHETSTFELWNGDKLVGCVDWQAVILSTGLGPVHVSAVHTEAIRLSLGGIDLVEKPYKSADGDRYFLGALKGAVPRRILGRTYPRSQFIGAHAGGRIEYRFEKPVCEFHAFLALYESYHGTKGNVIFKLETEEGQVFASRPIRHFQLEEVYVRFKPTKKLVLITDPNGSNQEDWSVWLRPEVR